MRKMIMLVLVGLFVAIPTVSAQEDSDDLRVTVYNQGTALIQDRRTLDLETGLNQVDFTDVAASIDPTSVRLVSLTDPAGTVVLEQNFVFDLVNSAALLQRYLDETIEVVTREDGMVFIGQLLSGRNNEVILRQDDGQVVVINLGTVRNIRFPELPEGLITRPTLRWTVSSAAGGAQNVELTYLTSGINWTADYNVLLAADQNSLGITGWVTLNNTSGTSFEDAQVKLVAGDVNRLPESELRAFDAQPQALGLAVASEPNVEQREFFEYQLYEIARRVTVGNNETKQVEFVNAVDVASEVFFVYEGSQPFFGYRNPIFDQAYGITGVTDVQTWLEFNTGPESGLDADLPEGRIRVFQADIDESALLIGESRIDETPTGEDVQLRLGNAFDLVGERRQTDFRFIGNNVVEETFEIKLRNRKDDDAVTIRVPERLTRWREWEIIQTSHDFEKLDVATIEFRLDVAPGEEQILTYTVRYTFPR